MKKVMLMVVALVFGASMVFAQDAGVNVEQKTENKGQETKIKNQEETKLKKGTKEQKKEQKKEMKKSQKKERKEIKEAQKEAQKGANK